jgi:hypothetical protein
MLSFARERLFNFSPQYLCLYGCSVARAGQANFIEIGKHLDGHELGH